MTEEEKERLEDLENLLPCILYYHRTEHKDDDDNDETITRRSYSLYDGFDKEHRSLSLRLHQQECSICLMEYEDGEKLTSSHNLNCLHAFHRDCMKKWLVSNSECPCCRKGFLEFGDNDEGADDNEIDTISPLIASRFALLATTFQQQVGRMRQDIENQLEPIILRLEQQHQNETIDPPNANHHQQRRTTRNDTATQYDESSPYATGSSSIIQQRMERIREGLSDQFVNMMVRIEQNGNARRGAGDNNSGAGDDTSWRNEATGQSRTTVSTMDDHPIQENTNTRPDILAATHRVLQMGSARWNDVTRMVGESLRGREAAALQSSSQTRTTPT